MTLNIKNKLFHQSSMVFMLLLLAGAPGCTKLVEVDAPETNPASATVYTSDVSAASVLTNIYVKMSQTSFAGGSNSISVYAGLSADELLMPSTLNITTTPHRALFTNSNTLSLTGFWKELYQHIYVTNAAIEGIAHSKGGMTDSMKTQLTGEAKFMRAFLHFYAVNLFGNVPYVDTTDQLINATVSRDSRDEVFNRIEADLKEAKALLSENFKLPSGGWTTAERCRPSKWSATAMLARVYLYRNKWAEAEAEATTVLDQTARFALATDLKKMTDKASKEVIWHLQPTELNKGSQDGIVFYTPTVFTQTNPIALRPQFLTNFTTGDKRRTDWIDSMTIATVKYYCPAKYRVKAVTQTAGSSTITLSSEYSVVLRLAEVLLIRAEARAKQDKVAGAQADLNAIRTRAGLAATTANDQATLITAIEKERQLELFTEWGHRWLDLKRYDRLNTVMPTVIESKAGVGATWKPEMALYPVPGAEIDLNPNLKPQNPGYN